MAKYNIKTSPLWSDHIDVPSESGSQTYTVSRWKDTDTWGCSCRGWTNYGKCKHLSALGKQSARPARGKMTFSKVSISICEFPECPVFRDREVCGVNLCTEHADEYEALIAARGTGAWEWRADAAAGVQCCAHQGGTLGCTLPKGHDGLHQGGIGRADFDPAGAWMDDGTVVYRHPLGTDPVWLPSDPVLDDGPEEFNCLCDYINCLNNAVRDVQGRPLCERHATEYEEYRAG